MSDTTSPLLQSITHEVRETWRFRYVISSFVSTTLKQRYRRSVLGFGWSMLGPILNYCVLGFVFLHTMRVQIPGYLIYIFSGALIFGFFSSSINAAPHIMLRNESYIKKIYIPKLVFVLNAVIVELVNFFLSFVSALILAILLQKVELSWSLFSLPLFVVLSLMFALGASIILSVLTVFFRDIGHIVPVAVQVIFFGTPIMYTLDLLPERFQKLALFNPVYYFIECFRSPLYLSELPDTKFIVITAILSITILVFGLILLKKYDNKIVFKL